MFISTLLKTTIKTTTKRTGKDIQGSSKKKPYDMLKRMTTL